MTPRSSASQPGTRIGSVGALGELPRALLTSGLVKEGSEQGNSVGDPESECLPHDGPQRIDVLGQDVGAGRVEGQLPTFSRPVARADSSVGYP